MTRLARLSIAFALAAATAFTAPFAEARITKIMITSTE